MKTLLILLALHIIPYCLPAPNHGVGFVKHAEFSAGIAPSHFAEGHVEAAGAADGGIGGGVVKTVAVEKHIVPAPIHAVGGASFSASFGGGAIGKHVHGGRAEVVSEKVLEVEAEAPPPIQPAKKTVIERTVIPNYVEKTIQVPTYVEKTIRVPTYVEKTIKVPAAPTIVEKTISREDVPVPVGHKEVKVESAVVVPQVEDNVRVYHKFKARPHRIIHKEIVTSGGGGLNGGADYAGYAGGAGGGGFRAYASAGGNGEGLFDAIFNIPIQALGATRGLLNNFSGGFSAEGGYSKGFSAY